MLLKNDKNKIVNVKTLDFWYGAKSRRETIENIINHIEMYDNGCIKRVEWKDEESFEIYTSFCSMNNQSKGIFSYILSTDAVGKDNLCKFDYEENGKYYTLFLNLQVGQNTELLSDEEGYLQIFITDNNYYNELIQNYSILKEEQIILPFSHIKLVKEEILDIDSRFSHLATKKRFTYMSDENEVYTKTEYELKNIKK